MKSDSNHSTIADLLRANPPEVRVPSGMEGRIRRAVEQRQRPSRRPAWFGLAVAAAAACFVALVVARPKSGLVSESATAQHDGRAAAPISVGRSQEGQLIAPVVALMDPIAPLEAENGALMRDARRAGGFLIDCLPSLGVTER